MARLASAPSSWRALRNDRLRFGDFFSRMWLEEAWRALTFAPAVTLKRFLEPEWVFIFGMWARKYREPAFAGLSFRVGRSYASRSPNPWTWPTLLNRDGERR